ncbi:Ribonuclease H1 [Mycoblastus sanguinarius]|nr:Ribonuclease H1 [Mycoblastus sanguinarius]
MLSCLHLHPPISALHQQSGVEISLPESNTSGPIRFKAIIFESTSVNLVLKKFYDTNVANKIFGSTKYAITALPALEYSRYAFTTPFDKMRGQPELNDRDSPQFKVDGLAQLPFTQDSHFFTPDFFVCDHIFCRQEYESEFVAILGLRFLEEYFIRAQWTETGWTMQLPPFPIGQIEELEVYTDGCCLSNGQAAADDPDIDRPRGGFGIHFPSLPTGWDTHGALSSGDTHTNQKAELTAVIRALQMIRMRKIPCGRVSLFTDSKYAVQGLNEWIPRWRGNGYRTSKNHGVANADLFRSLDKEVSLLEGTGVPVKLSYIPREANQEADALSKLGAKSMVPNFTLEGKPDPSRQGRPEMIIGRPLMVKAKPLVQWTSDGIYWFRYEPIETWSDGDAIFEGPS